MYKVLKISFRVFSNKKKIKKRYGIFFIKMIAKNAVFIVLNLFFFVNYSGTVFFYFHAKHYHYAFI